MLYSKHEIMRSRKIVSFLFSQKALLTCKVYKLYPKHSYIYKTGRSQSRKFRKLIRRAAKILGYTHDDKYEMIYEAFELRLYDSWGMSHKDRRNGKFPGERRTWNLTTRG